jgi:hypothetical protein
LEGEVIEMLVAEGVGVGAGVGAGVGVGVGAAPTVTVTVLESAFDDPPLYQTFATN